MTATDRLIYASAGAVLVFIMILVAVG